MATYIIKFKDDVKKWETAEKQSHLSSAGRGWHCEKSGASSGREALIDMVREMGFSWPAHNDVIQNNVESYKVEKFTADFMILRRVDKDSFYAGRTYALTAAQI